MKNIKAESLTIDEYVGTFPEEVQNKLQELRMSIKNAAPESEEKITYKMPTFELNGKHLVYFSAWKHHIAMYPIPLGTKAFNKELSRYIEGRGTLKFSLDEPLPIKLIVQIVKFRVADNLKNTVLKFDERIQEKNRTELSNINATL